VWILGVYWQGIVKITQIPNKKNLSENDQSWLCNPFSNDCVYGTKITVDKEYFSWKFFIKESSQKEAYTNSICLHDYLKEIYPGLSGEVKAKSIDSERLNKKKRFFEIVLPPPYFNKKINIFEKIINLFTYKSDSKVIIYILWQRDDSSIKEIEGTELETGIKLDENYKIKIYINPIPEISKSSEMDDSLTELEGHLKYLTTNIQNTDGDSAQLKQAPNDTWERILEGRVFYKNHMNLDTGRFYRKILDIIPEEKIPGFVNPKILDFNVNEFIPLEKAIIVRNENVNFIQKPNPNDICLGYYIRRGVITDRKTYLSAHDLIHHVFIGGLTGSGKTTLLNHIQHEISSKVPKCGVLIISLKKEEQDVPYKLDLSLKYGDPDLRVPYYFAGENIEVTFEQLAALLASSLGLKQPVDIILYNVMLEYFEENNNLPDTLKELFGKLLVWFKTYAYHKKYQTNIKTAIKNRALKATKSPILNNITKLPSIKPSWFIEWMNGKNVFIDLSDSVCNEFIKRLLINLIFQMIRIFFPQTKANKLKNVVILDEIGEIGKKPATLASNDDEFISQYFLEKVLSEFLKAFRSRGICTILATQKPSELFESIYSLPSILFLFTIAHSCSKLFTNDLEEQDVLRRLGKRRAIVIDGVNGRKFAIYTIDFNYEKISNSSHTIKRNVCSSCENFVYVYDNFCSACGAPLIKNLKLSNENLKKVEIDE